MTTQKWVVDQMEEQKEGFEEMVFLKSQKWIKNLEAQIKKQKDDAWKFMTVIHDDNKLFGPTPDYKFKTFPELISSIQN